MEGNLCLGAAPLGFEQHPLDDVDADAMGAQVFDGGHGVAAPLERDAVVHDQAAAGIAAGFAFGGGAGAGKFNCSCRHPDLALSGLKFIALSIP